MPGRLVLFLLHLAWDHPASGQFAAHHDRI
jgi:hypothetical protein